MKHFGAYAVGLVGLLCFYLSFNHRFVAADGAVTLASATADVGTAAAAPAPEVGEAGVATEAVMPEPSDQPKLGPLNPVWRTPDFTNQEHALGWSPDAFKVPKGMEERVRFWRDIYTHYSSEQGILHDSRYVGLIYETLEFTDITARGDLTLKQKERARRKRVDDKKKEILARFRRLATVGDPATLAGDDQRYWDLFARVDEPKKFLEAGKRGRLRFQLGQHDIFTRGIYFSGRYLRQMEEIFRHENLPVELTRLPFVESSFNLKARSRVGASGIWQFMRAAAKPYMRMDASADERNDPLSATRAAAKKLRDNYVMLKSWPLAVTAWNHGPAGVRRLTEKLGSTDIVDLIDVRKGRFKFASASFYASFLAALDVEAHANLNFGRLEVMPELRGAEVWLTKNESVREFGKWFGGDFELGRTLNPHLSESVWNGRAPLGRKHVLRVPLGAEAQARAEME